MSKKNEQASTAINPTWTWGSSATLKLSPTAGSSVSAQLAQVSLPEPAVCSFYFQAAARIVNPADIHIGSFTVNLSEGLGRVTVPRQITFANQPSAESPLEWTLPFIPLHALQVDVQATANFRQTAPPESEIELQIFFVIAPLTRIPQQIQKLQFGMALPGEADDLDDELRAELEAEGPTVAAMMGEGRQHVDGSSPEEEAEGDDDDEPAVERTPAWLMTLVDQMTRRLGRPPTRPELAKAVRRVQTRVARRRVR